MKKVMLFILALIVTTSLFSQVPYGQLYDKGEAYYWRYKSSALDAGGTFTTNSIPAFAWICLFNETVIDTGEVDSDTKTFYQVTKRPFVIVQVLGTVNDTLDGSDSLSSLYLQGRTPANEWTTIDTIITNGETSHMTEISYNTLPHYTELRLVGTVADLSSEDDADVVTHIEFIIPKIYR